jgi:hypothetical protein
LLLLCRHSPPLLQMLLVLARCQRQLLLPWLLQMHRLLLKQPLLLRGTA